MLYKISELEKKYPNWYDVSNSLTKDEQQWIWENTALPEDTKQNETENLSNGNVNGSVNEGRKQLVNPELIWNKPGVILRLRQCTYETPPNEIAVLLQELFSLWPSKEGHWLWTAQRYTPRTINWQVASTVKAYKSGAIHKNPSAYFTCGLKYRKKRREGVHQ